MSPTEHRPVNATKVNTESIRKIRRRKLLRYSLPLVIITLFLAAKLISLSVVTNSSRQLYDTGAFVMSSQRLDILGFFNVFEPYKYFYNKGTADYRATNYEQAEQNLKEALKTVPLSDECFVRVNLVHTYIAMADKLVVAKDYTNAIIAYDQAKATVEARDCGLKLLSSGGGGGTSDETKQADKQLQEKGKEASDKQSEAKKAQNGDQSESSDNKSSENSDDNSEPSEQQQNELEQKQSKTDQQARRNRSADRADQQSTDDYSDRSYEDKNW